MAQRIPAGIRNRLYAQREELRECGQAADNIAREMSLFNAGVYAHVEQIPEDLTTKVHDLMNRWLAVRAPIDALLENPMPWKPIIANAVDYQALPPVWGLYADSKRALREMDKLGLLPPYIADDLAKVGRAAGVYTDSSIPRSCVESLASRYAQTLHAAHQRVGGPVDLAYIDSHGAGSARPSAH